NQSSHALEYFLRTEGYSPIIVETVDEGLEKINASENLKVVLLNVELSANRGLDALERIKHEHPQVIVIVIGARGQTARRAPLRGAMEVLSRHTDMENIRRAVDRAFGRIDSRNNIFSFFEEETEEEMPEEQHVLVGESEAMFELNREIGCAASFNISVLLEGETGTGKGLVARLIHKESERADAPFVSIDCGAVPHELREAELLGHEKGAFTGAESERPGAFEQADGGTLFLDEVSNMSPALQETLLNVLQEREVQRVGGTRTRSVDVRVISATHQKLREMVAQGTFREDLYYRLCGHQISLPPLRERIADIPLLVTYFLQRIEAENERARSDISEEAMGLLQTYNWPGNVRELERCLESATVTSQGEVIMPRDLPQEIRAYSGDEGSERSEPETRSSETSETPVYQNLLDLPVMVFCQFLSDGQFCQFLSDGASDITDRQIAEWWEAFSNDGRARANSARREIDNWRLEFNTTNLEFPIFSDDWIRRVIDDAISQLSNLRHSSEPIEEAESISIKGRTRKGSLTAVLHEVVKSYGGDREKIARELRISLAQLERWLSYRTEDDGSLFTSIEASRRLERFPYDDILRLLTEPISLFMLENFSRPAWRNRSRNGQRQAVHLALKVLSKRLAGDHGCIYFGGMIFSQIEWNVYRRAPYLYTDHAEAATALDVDIRTFRKYWPESNVFPSHHTLFRE
ncbi:sigma-54-dependent Fis family transcriptional regulator, partial [Candidatus Poribacteria bacterium]|nr:sigma-54-dependent Fis family transcriptional regulator [Candidatus Poribacteria bacterium]